MTEQEAFEAWWKTESYISKESYFRCWQASAERKDKIIEQQAAEIEALRGFAQAIESIDFTRFDDAVFAANFVRKTMKLHKLIDEKCQPTALLTGENK